MFKRLITVALVFGMAALAPPASAQTCAARDAIAKYLSTEFHEELQAGGLQVRQNVQTLLEIWASSESGSFTILMTLPTGVSCIVATGEHFFIVTQQPAQQNTASGGDAAITWDR